VLFEIQEIGLFQSIVGAGGQTDSYDENIDATRMVLTLLQKIHFFTMIQHIIIPCLAIIRSSHQIGT